MNVVSIVYDNDMLSVLIRIAYIQHTFDDKIEKKTLNIPKYLFSWAAGRIF